MIPYFQGKMSEKRQCFPSSNFSEPNGIMIDPATGERRGLPHLQALAGPGILG